MDFLPPSSRWNAPLLSQQNAILKSTRIPSAAPALLLPRRVARTHAPVTYAYQRRKLFPPPYLVPFNASALNMDAMSAPRAVTSCKTPAEDGETNAESETKRRKIRKGTRSCWECKRRKMKCLFGSPTDATCISCQQRGTKCVGQEFPEEVSPPVDRSRKMGDRFVRVENLVDQLIKKGGNDGTAAGGGTTSENGGNPDHGIPTPVSTDSESSRFLALYKPLEVRIRDPRAKA
jgi:hypothetical protein